MLRGLFTVLYSVTTTENTITEYPRICLTSLLVSHKHPVSLCGEAPTTPPALGMLSPSFRACYSIQYFYMLHLLPRFTRIFVYCGGHDFRSMQPPIR